MLLPLDKGRSGGVTAGLECYKPSTVEIVTPLEPPLNLKRGLYHPKLDSFTKHLTLPSCNVAPQ